MRTTTSRLAFGFVNAANTPATRTGQIILPEMFIRCSATSCIRTFTWVNASASSVNLLRSEEHTSELQSHLNLVCRLLLEKKKTYIISSTSPLHPHLSQ